MQIKQKHFGREYFWPNNFAENVYPGDFSRTILSTGKNCRPDSARVRVGGGIGAMFGEGYVSTVKYSPSHGSNRVSEVQTALFEPGDSNQGF